MLVWVVLCGYLMAGAFGSEFKLETFPDPTRQFQECGRERVGFVCDPDRIIDPKAADQIQSFIDTLQNEDFGDCNSGGTQVGVALMNKFHIPSERDAPTAARHFAKGLHDKWGVGHVNCNNGILFLLSKSDRQIYISTGSGISHRLTDDDVHVIISNMKEGLRAGQFSETIVNAIDEIRGVLQENKRAVDKEEDISFTLILSGFFLVVFFLYRCAKCTPYSKCSRKLSLIERQAKAQKFDHSSCPICLEEFPKNIKPSHSRSQRKTSTETTSTTEPTTSTNQKAVEILDCGHTFCKECIEEWFSSRRSEVCPICRAGEPSTPSKVPHTEEVFQNELRFRLLSLNRHYPNYVTTTMVDDWTRDRNYNFQSSYTAFHNPPSSGSSSSWGGGFSGGGGGGGGSW